MLANLTEIHDEIEEKWNGEQGISRINESEEENEDEDGEIEPHKPEYDSDYIVSAGQSINP